MWSMSSGYMSEDTTTSEIILALWTGLRLSLKTAGAVTLLSTITATLIGLGYKFRLAIGIFASLIFSILFQARFPYYKEFQSTFGLEIVHGLNDDVMAIFWTLVEEYGLIWRFILALILTLMCIMILSRILLFRTMPLPHFALESKMKTVAFSVGLFLIFVISFVFVRFGGSFTYAGGVNWENAGVTSDHFLNECILDDVQALYRANAMEKRMQAGDISGVDKENILVYAKSIAGHENLEADNLLPYLERTAEGAKIPKPKHIFVIVGETWMQWPLIGKYEKLHIADGIKSLIAEENCYYSRNFMPNGDYTSSSINGFVTGLNDVNIRVNYQPKTFEDIYPTAFAPPFKELGYKVDFWYGGVASWDNIGKMSLAQGFDNFYGYPDYHASKQNAWGTKDENLFNALLNHLADEPPTVHLILTTSNHPPYNLDLKSEGFNIDAEISELNQLPNMDDVKTLATELGHYWYMDKVTTNFIRQVVEKYPESIFVITGDHAVRCDPGTRPTIFEHQSVPFVIYGNGIKRNIFPVDVVGGHTSIAPTLIELIAPKGFSYYTIAPPLTKSNGVAFNREVFITNSLIGKVDSDEVELLPHIASKELNQVNQSAEKDLAQSVITSMRTLSWWLLTNGLNF
ncbi:MAG: LTA synthase family protein [Selenomonadaceae bacterium]|nr:LTA synthase family protein [Selenomonadaceae bacterium]